jgi:hypothetical protein
LALRVTDIFTKRSRKRKFLIVQGEFGKITDTDRSELCFLTV